MFSSASNVDLAFNNIYNSTMYNIYNTDADNVKAEHNYWGTVNETEISQKIYDCDDDITRGCVDFIPYLNYTWNLPSFVLVLRDGWNLVSFPLNVTNISEVFEPIKPYFNRMLSFSGYNFIPINPFTDKAINLKDGFWVKVNNSANLIIDGAEFESTDIPLNPGWNLVGYLKNTAHMKHFMVHQHQRENYNQIYGMTAVISNMGGK